MMMMMMIIIIIIIIKIIIIIFTVIIIIFFCVNLQLQTMSDNLSHLSASFFLTRFIINTCNNDTDDDDDDDKRNGLLSAHEIPIKSINEVSMYSRGLLFYQIIPQRNDRKIL